MEITSNHPGEVWKKESQQLFQMPKMQLRLAAMAGHMQTDKLAARRAALIDLLADGRPHTREEIWQTVEAQIGQDCWGKLPREALARDLAALRRGGIRIAYSRRPGVIGYYLQHPPLERPLPAKYEAINWELIHQKRSLSPQQKNLQAFAAADFAFNQKKLVLAEENPTWSAQKVNQEARRIVFGVSQKDMT